MADKPALPKEISFKATAEQCDEIFTIEGWFGTQTAVELYDDMVKFAVDESGKPVPEEIARQFFKTKKKREMKKYIDAFYKAVGDAYVNPTSGGK